MKSSTKQLTIVLVTVMSTMMCLCSFSQEVEMYRISNAKEAAKRDGQYLPDIDNQDINGSIMSFTKKDWKYTIHMKQGKDISFYKLQDAFTPVITDSSSIFMFDCIDSDKERMTLVHVIPRVSDYLQKITILYGKLRLSFSIQKM